MNMTRSEVSEQIAVQRSKDQYFIKSWEAGHSFVDFDLIERFSAGHGGEGAIEGFELLDMEQMWRALLELDPDKLVRVRGGAGEVIEWVWQDSAGVEKKNVYPFTPAGLMKIIDDEFFA
jgi:hypothetical protein